MALVIDPAGDEIHALKAMTDWRGKRVLEVGCGNGRLTQRLIKFGVDKIIAFDPEAKSIRAARKDLPEKYKDRVTYRVGNAEHVKQKPNQFDIIVFSWVL
jgi:ubiquinone/menaquinone biosynthesis C-methylase UbiE